MKYFKFYYKYLGSRIFALLALIVFVGLLDGVGISLVIPYFEYLSGENSQLSASSYSGKFISQLAVNYDVKYALLVILMVFILKGIFVYFQFTYKIRLKARITRKIRYLLMINLIGRESGTSEADSSMGHRQNLLSNEVDRLSKGFMFYLSSIQATTMVVVYLTIALFTNFYFSIIMVGGGIVVAFVLRSLNKLIRLSSDRITDANAEYQELLLQGFSSSLYLRVTGFLGQFMKRFEDAASTIENESVRMGHYTGLINAAKEPLNIAVLFLGVYFYLVNFGRTGFGEALVALMLFFRALQFSIAYQNHWANFLALSGSTLRIMSEKLINVQVSPLRDFVASPYGISLDAKHLSVRIANNRLFEPVDFVSNSSRWTVILGDSGAGKTTLLKVLMGEINDFEGLLHIKPSNFSRLASDDVSVGYVPQSNILFSDSVYYNITLRSKLDRDSERRFWNVCDMVGLTSIINSLSNGMHTKIGIGLGTLSGGEKQRIYLARELFKLPAILFLDEPTSALDKESETEIIENIRLHLTETTVFLITHNKNLIKEYDQIVHLQK
ncbi:ABC transporter ATP-binding protein/permease [Schleiferiaceae bacterium]|nr:ABC transporter ATP-binding protein/permease [Schleiferiaceae bacterium]